jgi:PAS domain S-box-containing protein
MKKNSYTANFLSSSISVINDIFKKKIHPPSKLDNYQVKMATIIENSDDAIMTENLKGIIETWNLGAQKMFGYTKEEAIGRSISLIIPPDKMDEEKDILLRLSKRERIKHFQSKRMTKDQHLIDVSITVSPFIDNEGRVIGASKILRDISALKRKEEAVQESENRFRVMANSAPVLIWISGTDKLCNWFNQVWLDYTGRSMEQEMGNGWAQGIHPDDYKGCLETYLSAFDLREPFSMEYRLRKADGQYGWILDNGIPIFEGQIFKGYIGSCVDISNHKKIENDLHLAKIAAESASLVKSRFLDIAAHELRTPVTAFSLLLQLTQRQLEKGIPFEASVLTRLRVMADKISRLVVDLLDVSRLERGAVKLHLERIDLNSVITECVNDLKLHEPDRMIKIIKPETPVEFNFDSLRIAQVISNVLDNARKYTPKQSPFEITLETKPGHVRISIRDHGPGISDEQKTNLFNAFSRGSDELTSRSGGLGLGLFICSEIIKLHGGTIGVISKMGEGSTFYFELPTEEVK